MSARKLITTISPLTVYNFFHDRDVVNQIARIIASYSSGSITLSSPITGYTVGPNTPLSATDTILQAFGKLQGQINAVSSTPANPTALVGTTAINGVATTYMRSDAAPAINQTMTPTWTGKHIFTFGSNPTGNETIRIANDDGWIAWYNTANTVRSGYIQIRTLTGAVFGTDIAQPITFITGGTTAATLSTTNRLGVNTTNPLARLHVSTGTSGITSSGPNNGILLTDNANFNRLYFENLLSTAGQRVFAFDNVNGTFSLGSYTDTAMGTAVASIISFAHATGQTTISNLSGTGSRIVVASASGVLSATDTFVETGTFAVQLDGITAGLVSGNINYTKVGKIVTLYIVNAITGTGVGTPTSINCQTGEIPAALRPNGGAFVPCYGILDNSTTYSGIAAVDTNGLLNIQLIEASGSRINRGAAFVVGGNRGLGFAWSITYSTV